MNLTVYGLPDPTLKLDDSAREQKGSAYVRPDHNSTSLTRLAAAQDIRGHITTLLFPTSKKNAIMKFQTSLSLIKFILNSISIYIFTMKI